MAEVTIEADGFTVGRGVDNPDVMRLRFSSGDDIYNIVIPIEFGQLVARDVERTTVELAPAPIGPDEMRLDSVFELLGWNWKQTADCGKRLILTIEVPDGVRTLPIDLSSKQVAELIDDLAR